MIPLIYASSENDDDEDDKNYDGGKDNDNVNELEKEKNAERDFDMSVAELMDTVDQFKTSDFVYMCHYMKDVGHFKQEVNCLDWAMNDPNPEESIKNFAILKGAGLYD